MLRDLLYPFDIDSIDNRNDDLVASACRWFGKPYTKYFRAQVIGLDRVPTGAALFVGNHNASTMNPEAYILCNALFERFGVHEVPYGLGHEWAINLPGVNRVIIPLGAVRAGHDTAHRLFLRGRKVLVYPGSDFDALRPFSERNRIVFDGRTGFARLALKEGVPIVPVVAAGAQSVFFVINKGRRTARLLGIDRSLRIKVWPMMLSIPWGLTFGPPPAFIPFPSRIRLEVLPPIVFERHGAEAANDDDYVRQCANRVVDTMQNALDRMVAAA